MNTILQKRIEEAAFQEGSMYDTIQEKNAAYNAAIKVATFALKNQWIPVEEALPEKSGDYLVIVRESSYSEAYFNEISTYNATDNIWYYVGKLIVTHWMPIPTLKGGKDE